MWTKRITVTIYGRILECKEGMDIDASEEKYTELLKEKLQARYPDAEITISTPQGTEVESTYGFEQTNAIEKDISDIEEELRSDLSACYVASEENIE